MCSTVADITLNEKELLNRPYDWPNEFLVCERCKDLYFSDYDQAVVWGDNYCTICFPPENDSLGG